MTSEPRHFRLFHTAGCHLCECAQALLAPLLAQQGWVVELVDIAGDDALEARYAVRIPVLREVSCGVELGWPFDEAAVLAAFSPAPVPAGPR
jgi:hypothetical protein